MHEITRIITPSASNDDTELDRTLRPQTFADFIGQEQLKANLSIFVAAAKKRGEPLDHILFSGPPGLGKTTLARILANEMGVQVTTTSGPVLEKKGDLAGIIKLNDGFIKDAEELIADTKKWLKEVADVYFGNV